MSEQAAPTAASATQNQNESVEYEYVEVPAGETGDGEQYEYVEVPAGDDNIQYEYVEAPADGSIPDGAEYEYVEVPEGADNIQYEYVEAPEIPAATAEAPAAEAPADGEQYEYVEVPADENGQPIAEETGEYEYVEVPESEAVAPALSGSEQPLAEESGEYEYVEVPAGEENVEYEYVEVPKGETDGGEQYEYVESPAETAVAPETAVTTETPEKPAIAETAEETTANPEETATEAPEPAETPNEEAFDFSEIMQAIPDAPVEPAPIEHDLKVEETATPVAPPAVELETPAAEPEAPAAEPEVPAVELETPATEPEAPAAEPEAPAVEPEAPAAEPEAPAAEPETLAAEPETPAAELETLAAEPEAPAVEPEAPAAEPETTAVELEAPAAEPETPAAEPETTAVELETPAAEPEAPATQTADETSTAIDTLATDTIAAEETPEKTAELIAEEAQEESDKPSAENDMLPPTGAFAFDGAIAASFVGKDGADTVVLNNSARAFDRLSEWYLLISEFSVTPLMEQKGAEIPLSDDVFCQGAFVNPDGSAESFVNDLSLTVPNDQTALALCGIKAISLAGQENSTIELEGASGMLIGPDGAQLLFTRLNKLVIPDLPPVRQAAPESKQASVTSNTPVTYALPLESAPESDVFSFAESDGEQRTDAAVISIKTGYSPYGWNVTFKNGQAMSLADVRTYQSKHGVLPDTSGTVAFKRARLVFENAKKIRVYEKPAYCGYGKKPQ